MRQKGFINNIILAGVLITGVSLILIFRNNRIKSPQLSHQSNISLQNTVENWKSYDDKVTEYSFKYPESLSYEIISNGDLLFFDNSIDDYENCKQGKELQDAKEYVNNLCLTKSTFEYHRLVLMNEKYFKASKDDLTNLGFSKDLFKDDKERNWDIRFKLTKDGEPLRYNAFISRSNGKYNVITFISYKDDNQNIDLFKQMLSTIEFKN